MNIVKIRHNKTMSYKDQESTIPRIDGTNVKLSKMLRDTKYKRKRRRYGIPKCCAIIQLTGKWCDIKTYKKTKYCYIHRLFEKKLIKHIKEMTDVCICNQGFQLSKSWLHINGVDPYDTGFDPLLEKDILNPLLEDE